MSELVTVEIKGLVELQKRLQELPEEVMRPILRDVLRDAGNDVKAAIVAEAPRDSGFLAEHFRVRTRIYKEDVRGTAFIGTQPHADYPHRDGGFRAKLNKALEHNVGRISVSSVARYLEFGTRKMAANPFMSRAWEGVKDVALNKIVNGIREALQRVGAQ